MVKHIYGPVPSRRLGSSLGVDPVPMKTCCYNCVYCQLGETKLKTLRRKPYIKADNILKELEKTLRSTKPDFITISGSGEPTLNSQIGKLVRRIKEMTDIPLAVITNGAILGDMGDEVLDADVILPSLDAADPSSFTRINRPHPYLSINKVVEGLSKFRKEFKGKIWLEVMLVGGINDAEEQLLEIKKAVELIKPDKVQLNLPLRPPPCDISPGNIKMAEEILGGEIIVEKSIESSSSTIEETLSRRPMTAEDISTLLRISKEEVLKMIEILVEEDKVETIRFRGKKFFRVK